MSFRFTEPLECVTFDSNGKMTVHKAEPKCKHGIEQSRCLSIECVKPTTIPVRGEPSWDSKLQPQDVGSYLSRLQFNFQPLTLTTRKSIQFLPFPYQWFSLSESPKKSRRKPRATRRETPVIGYRGWRVVGKRPRLQSVNEEYGSWSADHPTVAKCKRRGKHTAPDYNCECGLYVLASLRDAPNWYGDHGVPEDVVVGAVVGWGEVIQHGTEGWRAQYARPIAFLDTEVFGEQPLLRSVAKRYQLPILQRRGFELYAKEYGESFK